MPAAVIMAVVGAVASTGLAAVGLGTLIGGSLLTTFAVTFATSLVLGGISSMMTGKPKSPSLPNYSGGEGTQSGIMTVVRGSAEPRRACYGRIVSSGVLLYQSSSGTDNKYRHIVVAVADHEIDGVEGFYFSETWIPVSAIDGTGNVTSGHYANKARIQWKNGSEDQTAFADLTADDSEWTSSHRCQGVFVFYLRLEWDRSVYPNGIPNPRVMFRGKKLWDPRLPAIEIQSSSAANPAVFTTAVAHGLSVGDRIFLVGHATCVPEVEGEHRVTSIPSTTTFCCAKAGKNAPVALTSGGSNGTLSVMRWSQNAALADTDYFLSPVYGMKAKLSELNQDENIANANICDELVGVPAVDAKGNSLSRNFTVSISANTLTLSKFLGLPGDVVRLSTTGVLPAPLSSATDYYLIGSGPLDVGLASSYANAIAGTAIDIADAGSGVHSAVRTHQPRYTLCGAVIFGRQHSDIMTDMLSASGGAPLYIQGMHEFRPAAYRAPVGTLGEINLRAAIEIDPAQGLSETFNRVVGRHVNAADRWQETDFPPVTRQAWIDDDGEEKDKDIPFPFSVDPVMVQRIAGIYAQRSRQEIRGKLPCNQTVSDLAVLDNIQLSESEVGWSDKEFLITRVHEGVDGCGIDLDIWEESELSYSFDPNSDAIWIDPAPNTTLVSPLNAPAPPTSLVLDSGNDVLGIRLDGTVFSRIKAAWTPPLNAFVTSGGQIEIQCKRTADAAWPSSTFVEGSATGHYILDVIDGDSYDVRVRSVNFLFVPSIEWAVSSGHVVLGKSARPNDVSGFSAQQSGAGVNFKCTPSTEGDNDRIEIRYTPLGSEDYASAIPVANILRGNAFSSGVVPPGSWTFMAKAFDTSGNESLNVALQNLLVWNSFSVVSEFEQAPRWKGAISGFVKHWSGVLVPCSERSASELTNAQLFTQFCPFPVPSCVYESPEIDLGFDAEDVRVWSNIGSQLGPGVVSGVADPVFSIDFRNEAASFDGFENWTIGIDDFRRMKARLTLTPSVGNAKITSFKPVCDVESRTEQGTGTAAAGGTRIEFAQRFFLVPWFNPSAASSGGAARYAAYEDLDETGATVRVYDGSGSSIGGPFTWLASGA